MALTAGRAASDWIALWPFASSSGFALARGAVGNGAVQWLEHLRQRDTATTGGRWTPDLQRTATFMGWSVASRPLSSSRHLRPPPRPVTVQFGLQVCQTSL